MKLAITIQLAYKITTLLQLKTLPKNIATKTLSTCKTPSLHVDVTKLSQVFFFKVIFV